MRSRCAIARSFRQFWAESFVRIACVSIESCDESRRLRIVGYWVLGTEYGVRSTRETGSTVSPVSSLQSPVSSLQSPVSSLQSPVSSLQSPVTSHQSPVSSLQSPIPNPQSPIPNPPSRFREESNFTPLFLSATRSHEDLEAGRGWETFPITFSLTKVPPGVGRYRVSTLRGDGSGTLLASASKIEE